MIAVGVPLIYIITYTLPQPQASLWSVLLRHCMGIKDLTCIFTSNFFMFVHCCRFLLKLTRFL
jgi:hypothetical protein